MRFNGSNKVLNVGSIEFLYSQYDHMLNLYTWGGPIRMAAV